MRDLMLFLPFLYMVSVATGEVSTRVCVADGNGLFLPVDFNLPVIEYPEIMAGTRLTIFVDSNFAAQWDGGLFIKDPNREYGVLSGRDYNEVTGDWEGSHLEAAGVGACVYDWEDDTKSGFDLYGHRTAVAGDWFVIDYTATNVGDCVVEFYDYGGPGGMDFPERCLSFHHVPTRDFDNDTKVNFVDFAVFASHWFEIGCIEPDWCEGTDLDRDKDVDAHDIALFADYWLETTDKRCLE